MSKISVAGVELKKDEPLEEGEQYIEVDRDDFFAFFGEMADRMADMEERLFDLEVKLDHFIHAYWEREDAWRDVHNKQVDALRRG